MKISYYEDMLKKCKEFNQVNERDVSVSYIPPDIVEDVKKALKSKYKNTTANNLKIADITSNIPAANYSHDMRDRLQIEYEKYDGVSNIYVVESPCDCDRTVESVKNILGAIVNIHRKEYTITELIIRGNPDRPYAEGDLIEFKVKPFMVNRRG